jgi:hypothetical protein
MVASSRRAPSYGGQTSSPFEAHGDWLVPVGRIALAAQGTLYLVVGLLALAVARGQTEQADQRGALEAVVRQPMGKVLLGVLVVGLALHAVWRLTTAIRGEGPASQEDAHSVAKRGMHLGRAVIAGFLTVAAAKVWLDYRSDSTGAAAKEWTATVFQWSVGPYLVGALGAAMVMVGAWHMSKAYTQKFLDDLDLDRHGSTVAKTVTALGCAGWAARGAVFALVGWFLIQAAMDHDPNQAAGIDEALKRVVSEPAGPVLLGAIAAGLALFGLFRIAEGWFRRPDAVSHA